MEAAVIRRPFTSSITSPGKRPARAAAEEARSASRALEAELAAARVMLLNQAVLLAGVNDSLPVLVALSERLLAIGVLPYYLHLPDRVVGTSHFDVPEATAVRLHDGLRRTLSGYAVPRLVREVPGEASKVAFS